MSREDGADTAQVEESFPERRTCATMRVHQRLIEKHPGYVEARIASENRARAFVLKRGMVDRKGITVIPVVVHVVYNRHRPEQNISEEQIRSQIEALNRDYRAKNPDLAQVPDVFRELAADARVEFELATKDPAGQPTNGITRTATDVGAFPDDDSVKSSARGGADAWPSDQYLNIWVCQLKGGLLGYAQFPGGPRETDGVVILHSAFGTTGTARAPFNLGRSCTHEVGHWLNLRHIWGDDGNGCNGSDFVDDTPNQAGPNYGKPTFPKISCGNGPNGDLFMDYLDYVDDDTMHMFTAGQVERMQACLVNDRPTIGRIKTEETTPSEPPWPPAPPAVDNTGDTPAPAEPSTSAEPSGPANPPFGPFGPPSWPWPGFGLLPALLNWFGQPRMGPTWSPWVGPTGSFPYPGFPVPSAAETPWAPPSPELRAEVSPVSAMFETQLKAYEEAIRAYKKIPATVGGPWRQQELDRLYRAYVSVVHAYRQFLEKEMGDC